MKFKYLIALAVKKIVYNCLLESIKILHVIRFSIFIFRIHKVIRFC